MGKIVINLDKGKRGQNGGLSAHIDRTQKQENISKNIDTSKSHLNVELVSKNGTIDEMINQRIKEAYTGKKEIRKDAVTSCKFVLSGSHENMTQMSREELLKWSLESYKFFADKHGEKNIIRCTLHLDEKTPHLHLVVVPMTPDGRLCAKDFYGGKEKMKELHDSYSEKVGSKFGLERGINGENRKHIKTADYYRYVNSNELTAEKLIKLEPEKSKVLIGKLIELADKNQSNLQHISHKKSLENYERGLLKGNQQDDRKREQNKKYDRGIGL
jgi:hypothetical protein